VPVPAGTPAPPSGTPDPSTAAAPVVAALSSTGASGGDPAGQVCGAVTTVSAVPTQAGTTAFLTLASSTPPEVTAALIPVLAGAGGAGTPNAGEICQTVAGTVTGVVGGVIGGLPGVGGGSTSPASGGAGAAPAAVLAASGGGSGGGASLAFTGAETWMLALAGLALTVLGTILLRARRLARVID
jgi:DNA polymerase-3 subunit gamma/tau